MAVSKTKPVAQLMEVYGAGHRHFGENYVQEIVEKAPQMPEDVAWHFIGPIQSNKAKKLVTGVPGLRVVESVHSSKLATVLNKAVDGMGRDPLRVFVQINTSGEDAKSGVAPGPEATELVKHVLEACPKLELQGLMTIGRLGEVEPACFRALVDCRTSVCEELGLDVAKLELSMGMSGELETAYEMGSTNIRVGSTIFGARDYSAVKKGQVPQPAAAAAAAPGGADGKEADGKEADGKAADGAATAAAPEAKA